MAAKREELEKLLIQLFDKQHRTIDDLPYTNEFEEIWMQVMDSLSRHSCWKLLRYLAKKGCFKPKTERRVKRKSVAERDRIKKQRTGMGVFKV